MVRTVLATLFLLAVAIQIAAQSRSGIECRRAADVYRRLGQAQCAADRRSVLQAPARAGGQWVAANVPLAFILMNAYRSPVGANRCGGPEWVHAGVRREREGRRQPAG